MAAKLKVVKNTHLAHLDRALGALEIILNEDGSDVHQINQQLKFVEEKYSMVVSASNSFINKLSGENDDLVKELDDMDKLQETIIKLKYQAEVRLGEKNPPTPAPGNADNQATDATLHYAESETFATLKKRQLWNFFSPI